MKNNLHKTILFMLILLYFLILNCSPKTVQTKNSNLKFSSLNSALFLQKTFNSIFENVSKAVVSIYTERNIKTRNPIFTHPLFRNFFGRMRQSRNRKKMGLGSGIIYNTNGYIVTNYHVIKDVDTIVVKLYNNKTYKAKVLGHNALLDIAVLKIKAKNLKIATFGNSDNVKVGDFAIALGNPYGLSQSFTVGVVSAIARTGLATSRYSYYIQTDASINPGNSGGPLLDIKGKVIGINRMIYSKSGGSVGIGFAIPSNKASPIIDDLVLGKENKKPWIGIMVASFNNKKSKGVVVSKVYKPSPAYNAGIQVNDKILKINNIDINSSIDLREIIYKYNIGQKIVINLKRKSKQLFINTQIKKRPMYLNE